MSSSSSDVNVGERADDNDNDMGVVLFLTFDIRSLCCVLGGIDGCFSSWLVGVVNSSLKRGVNSSLKFLETPENAGDSSNGDCAERGRRKSCDRVDAVKFGVLDVDDVVFCVLGEDDVLFSELGVATKLAGELLADESLADEPLGDVLC